MKRIVFRYAFLTATLLFVVAPLHAQQATAPAMVQNADCTFQVGPGAPVITAVGTSGLFNNRTAGCTEWSFVFSTYGFSTASVQIVDAPNNNNAAGTPVAFQGTVFGAAQPVAVSISGSPSVGQGEIDVSGYYPYMGVALTSKTGTGFLQGTLYGWRRNILTGGGPSTSPVAVAVVESYEPQVQGKTASVMTGTSSTQVIAGSASNYMYISSCSVGNSSASVNTFVDLQDGSGGTVIWTFAAADNYGGESHTFGDHPLHLPTLGNGLYAADETTGASVLVSCNGFVSPNKYF